MRMGGICLFHGANNVSISGNSSFNIYWGSMGGGAWITFVDAAGRSYPVPEYLTSSYETFLKAINLMLQQDNEIARGQQRLIKRRMYDLCIDQGNQILPINGQESWSQVERDMKIVMRIPIWQEPGEINSKRTYCCPLLHCQLWNEDPSMGGTSTIDCKGCNSRFQISDLTGRETSEISSPIDISDLSFLRNYHLLSVSSELGHHHLGYMLNNHFNETAELANLDYAVNHYHKSIQLSSENHPSLSLTLRNVGQVLHKRFRHTGNIADLATAIDHAKNAIQLTAEGHPHLPACLSSMGLALLSCFHQTGDLGDLTSAIEHLQKANQLTPEGHPDLHAHLSYMGHALQSRFEQMGDLGDLTSAIEHLQKAIQLTPEGHPDLPACLSYMGLALQSRFEQMGDLEDLTSAIEHDQKAIQLTPEGHPFLPTYLSNMGFALVSRFRLMGDLGDLTSAIEHHQRAIQLTPEGHP
ncbi:hypothetical protein CPB83DRAFT_911561, partial [Crepidotus variabilis]